MVVNFFGWSHNFFLDLHDMMIDIAKFGKFLPEKKF